MPIFLVKTHHDEGACLAALESARNSPDILGKSMWGCVKGDHGSSVRVEAESAEAIREKLPAQLVEDAEIVPLNEDGSTHADPPPPG